MGIRQTATVVTNLLSSWGMPTNAKLTLETHAAFCERFTDSDIGLFASVVDDIRHGPPLGVDEVARLMRQAATARTPEPSENTGIHRARDRKLRDDRVSVFNAAVTDIRFSGSSTMAQLRLGRSMMARARDERRLIEDEAPHVLYLMDEAEIGAWLRASYEAAPDRKM